MEGYILTVLGNDSKPTEYWSETGFKKEIGASKIYTDPSEAISNFAGLQARHTSVELKVFKCKAAIEIIAGNPFSEVEVTEDSLVGDT